jgi:hypothetical protein
MPRLRSVCLVVVLFVGVLGVAVGDDKPDPSAVLEKGIKALGGEANLAKYRAVTWKGKGVYYGLSSKGEDISGEWAMQAPNRFRADLELKRNGATFHQIHVLNGDKGWVKLEKQDTEELDKDALAEEKTQMNAHWLMTLLPLKDKAFRLEALEKQDTKVGDMPVAGIKATRDNLDLRLYFAKESGLPLKCERTVRDARQEELFEDYKEADGIKYAAKRTVLRDGKKFLVVEISDYKPLEKLDEKLFEKP